MSVYDGKDENEEILVEITCEVRDCEPGYECRAEDKKKVFCLLSAKNYWYRSHATYSVAFDVSDVE